MTHIQINYFEYCPIDREFICNITADGEERDLEVSAAEFLKFKQASPLGFIAVDIERNVIGSDQGRSFNSYEAGTAFYTLEEYIKIVDTAEIEAELGVIIDRREGRDEYRELPQMPNLFSTLTKTA